MARWVDTYNEAWDIYDKFSECQDIDDNAFKTLLQYVNFNGKAVYEFGCGTGKYTAKLASLCDKLYANDISPLMIEKTKEKCRGKLNVEYIIASAENSRLEDESVDIVFGSWAGDRFNSPHLVEAMEEEFSRILKPKGSIWLFENYYLGEFSKMRKREKASDPALHFLKPFGKYGYQLIKYVPAYWEFHNIDEANSIFGFIFGEDAINFFNQKGSPIMEDNIAIFSRIKEESCRLKELKK